MYFLKIQVLSSAFAKLIPRVAAAHVKMFQKFWCEEYLKFGLLLHKSAKYGFKWLCFKMLTHFWAFLLFYSFFCNSISPSGKDLSSLLCLLNFVFSMKRHILFWICPGFNSSTFVHRSIYFSQP